MNGETLPLLLQEVNHRIRNLLAMVEAVLGRTQSPTVDDYRDKVIALISGERLL
jgi:two-component sensor histidine kinase